jgi:5-methylcytosine-specific restriction endonuclease McrA
MTRRDNVKQRRDCFDRARYIDHLGRTVMDCHICKGVIYPSRGDEWEADHVNPHYFGGRDVMPAHSKCHQQKTADTDIPAIAKSKRIHDRHFGIRRASGAMPGSKRSKWKKKVSGETVLR